MLLVAAIGCQLIPAASDDAPPPCQVECVHHRDKYVGMLGHIENCIIHSWIYEMSPLCCEIPRCKSTMCCNKYATKTLTKDKQVAS